MIGLIKQPISADVRGGGILRDEPKERLRRRLITTKRFLGNFPATRCYISVLETNVSGR